MKKRLLIICSIIGVLLAGFQFPIYAETTTPDYSSSTSIITSAALDQYFYDNYELLPYIESDGSQYINTGINASDHLNIKFSGSGLELKTGNNYFFGSRIDFLDSMLSVHVSKEADLTYLRFSNSEHSFNYNFSYYDVFSFELDKNDVYLNNSLIHSFTNVPFEGTVMYIFDGNGNNDSRLGSSIFKLYHFSIYDYAAAEGEGALVRDYYPARSKSGGIIGLYDAVSKTFVTTFGSVPFASPNGDPTNLSLGANITQFLSGSLSWIGAIFEGINEMPIIWVFIAIALAGVAFRWARRIVHF